MHSKHRWLNIIAGLCFTALSSISLATSTNNLPASVQLVGMDDPVSTSKIFQKRPIFLLVSSHSTADLIQAVPVAWLNEGWAISANQFISVAAVSKAPWLVKKLILSSGLTKLVEERTQLVGKKIPDIKDSAVIIDLDGDMVSALKLTELGRKEYAAFVINQAGEILPLLKAELLDDSDASINATAKKIVKAANLYFGAK